MKIIQRCEILNLRDNPHPISIRQEFNNGVITETIKVGKMTSQTSAKGVYSNETTGKIMKDFTAELEDKIPGPPLYQLNLSTTIAYEISGTITMLDPFKETGSTAVADTLTGIEDKVTEFNGPDVIIHVETIIIHE